MSDVCTCTQAQRIAEVEGERDRQYEYNIEQIARIAELERELKRARVELEVRLNPDGVFYESFGGTYDGDRGYRYGWMGMDLPKSRSWDREWIRGHAAGRAAVEAAINKKMEE